jgi:hypothetical protein
MDIQSFLIGLQTGKNAGGDTGGGDTGGSSGEGETIIINGVDPYYQKLAETLMLRDGTYLGDATTLSLKGFTKSDGSTLGNLPSYSFAGFKYVENMIFDTVIMINDNALLGCEKLKILDITSGSAVDMILITENALSGCTALESVICRNNGTALKYATVNANNGANDTFYVYVPAADYDTIISNLNTASVPTSRYRKLEEYPAVDRWNETFTVNFYDGEKLVDTQTVRYGTKATSSYEKDGYKLIEWSPAPDSVVEDMNCYGLWAPAKLEDASWDEINSLANAGKISAVYKVGDTKPVTLTYEDGATETISFRIVDMGVDIKQDGTNAALTMLADNLVKNSVQPASSLTNTKSDIQEAPNMSAFMSTLESALPSDLTAIIKPVERYKLTSSVYRKLFIPNQKNLNGKSVNNDMFHMPSVQYAHFENGNTIKRTKLSDSSSDSYWINSISRKSTGSSTYYMHSVVDGTSVIGTPSDHTDSHGVLFGFCI